MNVFEKKPNITAIVLTKNEEIHIGRCIENLKKINAKIKIVDSGSIDATLNIARKYNNLEIYYNDWINYASQFNWAIENCGIDTEWVMRIDADEIMDQKLIDFINKEMPLLGEKICGVSVLRGQYFLNRLVKAGDGKVRHLKIWRSGHAYCQKKWMDEHMILTKGMVLDVDGVLYDNNLHSIGNFIEKHNLYATREAIDYFLAYKKSEIDDLTEAQQVKTHEVKKIYYKFPIFVRVILFYCYIMIFRGGVFSGASGLIYHTLQKLFYRFLVDLKIYEANLIYKTSGKNQIDYLKSTL